MNTLLQDKPLPLGRTSEFGDGQLSMFPECGGFVRDMRYLWVIRVVQHLAGQSLEVLCSETTGTKQPTTVPSTIIISADLWVRSVRKS